jgi:hypothetical protein
MTTNSRRKCVWSLISVKSPDDETASVHSIAGFNFQFSLMLCQATVHSPASRLSIVSKSTGISRSQRVN